MKSIVTLIVCAFCLGCEPAGVPREASIPPVRGSIKSLFTLLGSTSGTSDELAPPYPNPFNHQLGDTTIALEFTLIDSGDVKLIIQNPIGDSVAVYVDERLPKGTRRYNWTPLNSLGEPLREGLYFVTLRVDPNVRNYIDSRLLYIENND